MEDPKSVYRGLPESARSLGEYLERSGIPYFLEDHDEIGVRSRSRALVRQTVFVESEQVALAESLRDDWLAASSVRAQGMSRRMAFVFLLSLLPVSIWVAGWFFAPEIAPTPTLPRVLVAWAVALVAFAQIESRRRSSERIEMPNSGGG